MTFQITSLYIAPPLPDTDSGSIWVDITITSGIPSTVQAASFDLISPSGNNFPSVNSALVSTISDQEWTFRLTFPQNEVGFWIINNIQLAEALGATHSYSSADIEALGSGTDIYVPDFDTVGPTLTEVFSPPSMLTLPTAHSSTG